MWTQCTSVTDRQTDRITNTKTVQRIASHGKNNALQYELSSPLALNYRNLHGLARFPDDSTALVFICHRVCSLWRCVSGDRCLWTGDVDLSSYNIPPQQLETFSRSHFGRTLTSLQLKGYQTAGIHHSNAALQTRVYLYGSNNDCVPNITSLMRKKCERRVLARLHKVRRCLDHTCFIHCV